MENMCHTNGTFAHSLLSTSENPNENWLLPLTTISFTIPTMRGTILLIYPIHILTAISMPAVVLTIETSLKKPIM